MWNNTFFNFSNLYLITKIRSICVFLSLFLVMSSCNMQSNVSQPTPALTVLYTASQEGTIFETTPRGVVFQSTAPSATASVKLETAQAVTHRFSNGDKIQFINHDGYSLRSGDVIFDESKNVSQNILKFETYLAKEKIKSSSKQVGTQAAVRTWTCYFWFIWCWNAVGSAWTGKQIAFEVSTAFTLAERQGVLASALVWNNTTNMQVKWVENPSAVDRVRIEPETNPLFGGSSYVGRRGGVQILKIQPFWLTNGGRDAILHHEMGHAAGLEHEHERCDRDTFVYINESRILAGYAYAFNKFCDSQHRDYGLYDYGSIMHYSPYTLTDSSGLQVMFIRSSNGSPYLGNPSTFGTATSLSQGDVAGINSLY